MPIGTGDLQAIFRRVVDAHGPQIHKESDMVIWFAHYLILNSEGNLKFESESGKSRYDLVIFQSAAPKLVCEFKYAWDGWPRSEIEKDKRKLCMVVEHKSGTPCFFLAYKEAFADKATRLREEFQESDIYAEIACVMPLKLGLS